MSGKYLLDTNALIYAIDRKLKLPKGHYVLLTDDEKLRNRHFSEAIGLHALTEMRTDL
jgi:rRNA-processing protein FCF1